MEQLATQHCMTISRNTTFLHIKNLLNKHSKQNIYIYIWLSAKRCTNGGSDFWLSIKSVSNTLSCCCFVCAFIIGQCHSGNNTSSKSGAAGEILFFESEKRHKIWPWKRTRSRWVLSMLSFMYMTNQNITSVTDLHRGDITLHSSYKIDYHEVLFLELEAPKYPSVERYVCWNVS